MVLTQTHTSHAWSFRHQLVYKWLKRPVYVLVCVCAFAFFGDGGALRWETFLDRASTEPNTAVRQGSVLALPVSTSPYSINYSTPLYKVRGKEECTFPWTHLRIYTVASVSARRNQPTKQCWLAGVAAFVIPARYLYVCTPFIHVAAHDF